MAAPLLTLNNWESPSSNKIIEILPEHIETAGRQYVANNRISDITIASGYSDPGKQHLIELSAIGVGETNQVLLFNGEYEPGTRKKIAGTHYQYDPKLKTLEVVEIPLTQQEADSGVRAGMSDAATQAHTTHVSR